MNAFSGSDGILESDMAVDYAADLAGDSYVYAAETENHNVQTMTVRRFVSGPNRLYMRDR